MPASPIACRRSALSPVVGGTHAGLLLHRYLRARADQGEETRTLLSAITRLEASAPYRTAFARWDDAQASRPEASVFMATLTAPLAIGLGSESATEVGLTLHHTYGMPFIPGSALKGLCRRAAAELKMTAPDDFQILFGDNSAASHLVFWDAWYDADSLDGCPFQLDTITVHHPQYYQNKGVGVWPTDFDDPTPIPFLCVKPGSTFLFSLDAPTPEWADLARRLLIWGLTNLGVGGKTNAGYGYFEGPKEKVLPPDPDGPEIEVIKTIIAKIRGAQDLSAVAQTIGQIDRLTGEKARHQSIQTLQRRLSELKLWIPRNAEKDWYKQVEQRLNQPN